MGEIKFVLDTTLKELNITPNKLSVLTGIRNNTIYSMVNGDAKTISINNLILILDCLNNLSKTLNIPKRISVKDIFIYIEN